VLCVTPSVHKNGYPYEIIGPCKDPVIVDDFDTHISSVLERYDIPYLDSAAKIANGNGKTQIPIKELFNDGFTIYDL